MTPPGGNTDYQLGQINARLTSIEKRLEDGSDRHTGLDERIGRLELVEAKRGGVLAAVAALAGIIGSAITLAVPYIKKL